MTNTGDAAHQINFRKSMIVLRDPSTTAASAGRLVRLAGMTVLGISKVAKNPCPPTTRTLPLKKRDFGTSRTGSSKV
jgi:hypothetical protein